MLFVLFQFDILREIIQDAIDTDTDIATLFRAFQHLDMLAFFLPDHRCENLQFGALRQTHQLADNLINGLLTDLLAAVRTVRRAHSRPEQTEIIIDLRHGSDRRAGILTGGLLINGNCRRQTFDVVHIRLVHLPQKLTGIGGQRLHIAALSLRINGIKCERGFSASGQTGQDNQLIARNPHLNILQIVLSGTFYMNKLLHGLY